MSVERLPEGSDGEDVVYTWPTFMTGHEFLEACDEYRLRGFFGLEVEVIVFRDLPDAAFREVIDYEAYLRGGTEVDEGACAVRFNARTPDDKFSVVWIPHRRDAALPPDQTSVAVGELQAVFGSTPRFMGSMITESITDRGRPYVQQLVAEGMELQPSLAQT